MNICKCGHGRRQHPNGDVCVFGWENPDTMCECEGFEKEKENER